MSTRKVLSINIEFELGDRKNGRVRLKEAHKAAVDAASGAVESALTPGSVGTVLSRMTYDYRWIAMTNEQDALGDFPDEDDD
jgi:hypothetical protein